MKKIIALMTLAISLNAFANSFYFTTFASWITSGGEIRKEEAAKLINDSQDFIQSGEKSIFLSQKIKDVQARFAVSEAEALDGLILASEQALK